MKDLTTVTLAKELSLAHHTALATIKRRIKSGKITDIEHQRISVTNKREVISFSSEKIYNREKTIILDRRMKATSNILYLITNGDIKSRLSTLQTGNPRKLSVVKAITTDSASLYEVALHEMFDDRRMMGEWFDLTSSDIEYITTLMDSYKFEAKMKVQIGEGIIEIGHKDKIGNLLDVLAVGNIARIKEGKTPFNMAQFIKKKTTKSFIETLEKEEDVDFAVKVVGKGGAVKTLAHLYFMIYMAQHMSDRFALDMIKVFVKGQLLQSRDMGGEDFKTLNREIDRMGDRVIGKRNTGLYIQVSKKIRTKIFGELAKDFDAKKESGEYSKSANIWNSELATTQHQNERARVEESLCQFIILGFVNSKEELYSAIERV